jgi:hypothetical protein
MMIGLWIDPSGGRIEEAVWKLSKELSQEGTGVFRSYGGDMGWTRERVGEEESW